jgi:hypothetical protein
MLCGVEKSAQDRSSGCWSLSSWGGHGGVGLFGGSESLIFDLAQVPGTRNIPIELKIFVRDDSSPDLLLTTCYRSSLETIRYGTV